MHGYACQLPLPQLAVTEESQTHRMGPGSSSTSSCGCGRRTQNPPHSPSPQVAVKEEIWNMMNADWLEKQAAKQAAREAGAFFM